MKNIALVLNSKYVEQALVFLKSLFINNKSSKFTIYIINSSLKYQEIERLKNRCIEYNNELVNIKIEEKYFEDAPILWKTHSKEAYYKLLLPEVLPLEVEKILYFDIDIVIDGNIDDLYELDIEQKCLAAVPDYFVNKYFKDYVYGLGIEEGKYFNSGVVLFNLKKIREVYKFSTAQKYIEENSKNFKFHDQEVLNALFKDNVLLIDEQYNFIAKYRGVKDFLKYKFLKNKNIKVIHYAGLKPWNEMYYGKYYGKFWEYAKDSKKLNYKQLRKNRNKNIIIIYLKTLKNIFKVM